MKPRLSIDTNVINARGGHEAMNALERWREEGRIEIGSSFRLKLEAARHPEPSARAKAARLPDTGEPFVWNVSAFGSVYSQGGAYFSSVYSPRPEFSEIASVVFPGRPRGTLTQPEQNDVMHLLSHIGSGADIFVTDGKKDFINDGKREALKARFGVAVMTGDETVRHLAALYGWTVKPEQS
jgi:hypothetical protein